MKQTTIKKTIQLEGIGIHSGKNVRLRFLPAPTNYGIVFRRVDFSIPVEIPAKTVNSTPTNLCTTIQKNGVEVKTIEHLMAAVNALEIDNLVVEINGEEVPIMDGSALPFYQELKNAGTKIQNQTRKYIKILAPIHCSEDNRSASLLPAPTSSFSFYIEFNHQAIGIQEFNACLSREVFHQQISSARTFGFEQDVRKLREAGLALGGSHENAIVLGENGKVLNKDGLRFSNEFVRHKILDSVGDLALAGYRIIGHYHGIKSGHAMNHALLEKLFASPQNWEFVELAADSEDSSFPQIEEYKEYVA